MYYVDNDDIIKAVYWHNDKWNVGLINAKKYKVASGSGIYALGAQELGNPSGSETRLKVYFKDGDNKNQLTVAYFKEHKWAKELVQ